MPPRIPPVSDSEIAANLRWLTEQLVTSRLAANDSGGLLGGEYGYAVAYENDTFSLHPYCWCEQPDCPWCLECTCPDDAQTYHLAGREVPFEEWSAAEGYRDHASVVTHPDRQCVNCREQKQPAPLFLHKPTGSTVNWYKYLGRGMRTDIHGDWRVILADCAASFPPDVP